MRTKKILLVDDDFKNSMFLKRFLEQEFESVTYAENGLKGWESFQALRPDLILLDVNMPVMDGFELAQKIRHCDKNVILFFLTDRTEKSDRLKGFSLKGNDYIPKPFYPEELIAKMKERFENETGNPTQEPVFKLGNTLFNHSLCCVEYNGSIQKLSVKLADILLILVQHLHAVVEREYILEQVWGHNSYSNSLALNVQITYLRKILNEDKTLSIESLKKKGYILKVKL
ncbi:MAG: response regulator transcription factor [Dysgonamonadaceae bacterium]|nr:response regulator transcription factor [Dysgonamonadaceae bacterium]